MKQIEIILFLFGFQRAAKALRRYNYQRAFRQYAGAQINRLTADWTSAITSIQQDIRSSLVTLRERARDLAKNNDLVKRWLRLCTANIVGPNGFTLQSDVRELVEDAAKKTVKLQQDKVANMIIEDAWRDWTKPQHCSVNGRLSFRQICSLVVTYQKRDGEAFLLKVFNSSKYGFQLHPIAPEALDEKKNEVLSNGNVILMGVELDKWRRPVNYYFKKIDPYLEIYGTQSYVADHIIIPASRIIYYFKQEYENQTRGITELANSMLMLHHLYKFDESTVIASRLGAAKAIVYTTKTEEPNAYKGQETDNEENEINVLEPGSQEQLPPGVDAKILDPTFPSDVYEAYQKSAQKKLSAGLNVAYASLSNDLSEGSYGSNRVGLLDERSQWKMDQQDFIDNILSAIYPDWLNMALLRVINLPPDKFEKFNRPHWVGRTWDWIDPLKDIAAVALALQYGIDSPWRIMGERGLDPEEVADELATWYKMLKEKGVPIQLGNITLNVNAEPAGEEGGDEGKKNGKAKNNGRVHVEV